MSDLRSKEITLCRLYIQQEAAFYCVAELGDMGVAQFRDLSSQSLYHKYFNEIRRCDEIEQKIIYIKNCAMEEDVKINDYFDDSSLPKQGDLLELEESVQVIINDLVNANQKYSELKKNFNKLVEMSEILEQTHSFVTLFGRSDADTNESREPLLKSNVDNFNLIAGIIDVWKIPVLNRLIWRSCRGNVIMKNFSVERNLCYSEKSTKNIFLLIFRGDQLRSKVTQLCEALCGEIFDCPKNLKVRAELSHQINDNIYQLESVIEETESHKKSLLKSISSEIETWLIKIKKLKSVFFMLNMFNTDSSKTLFIGECWCPSEDVAKVKMVLEDSNKFGGWNTPSFLERHSTSLPHPTCNKSNKFTVAFQSMIDAYGVPDYMEINPAIFTIITFPFLFSLMFGDAGHGLILLIASSVMILYENTILKIKNKDDIFSIIFSGRYIILLMGIFSVYSGFVYNDIFSKSVAFFESSWSGRHHQISSTNYKNFSEFTSLNIKRDYRGRPYIYGIDPIWLLAENEMIFTNSYKMKLSITIAVIHMLFAICLQNLNHTKFSNPRRILTEFFPMFIFLISLFGYLVILIFVKWESFNSSEVECAPSLLIHFINMMMFQYYEPGSSASPCSTWVFYHGQKDFQNFLIFLQIICIPWMLFGTPLSIYYSSKNETITSINLDEEDTDSKDSQSLSDLMAERAIHTVEFCLGCISHTASYLRLWALSLAHRQLSRVLWTMVLRFGLRQSSYSGSFILFIVFIPWVFLTVTILVVMEGLSAFLHALRLHWVEFQSKFYGGTGIPFEPFSFSNFNSK